MRTAHRKFVVIEGIQTSYFEKGEGHPVVLISGGGFGSLPRAAHSALDWDLNFDGLSEWCRVFAVDKLGHGFTDSPKRVEDYTRTAQTQHAYQLLMALGLEDVTLVGHSQGGELVMRLTLQHPELVRNCVIVDSGSLAPGLRRGFGEAPEPRLSRESQRWVLQKYSFGWSHITDDLLDGMCEIADRPRYREMTEVVASDEVIRRQIRQEMIDLGEETRRWILAGRLTTPSLVVWGYNDPTAPLSRGIDLFDIMCSSSTRHAEMHIFDRAGHFSFREHPEKFNRVLRSFVERS